MDENTKMARAYLKGLTTKAEFNAIVDRLFISETEKVILIGIYAENKSMSLLADELGYSMQTVKNLHRKILCKVSHLVYNRM